MEIQRDAIELIEQYARLSPTRETQEERQAILERLVKQHGIWNGYGGDNPFNWYTGQGERIGLLRPTLHDIEAMASDLGVTFTASDTSFDLDKQGEPPLMGTYTRTPAGLASAYRSLLLHKLILQKIAEVAGARANSGGADTGA